ncbi:MAG: hypothetical protein IT581_11820 [Verrucomicrobiales bacterium]|nr:hypothetical protein [Verrucomicrobiales bacterium]
MPPFAYDGAMHPALVLTVIGRDRPGLVEQLARLIADHGGNWLESRMNRLGGEFAGILRLTVPSDRESALRQALAALGNAGLNVQIRSDDVPAPVPTRVVQLELVGQDRPGIVRQIASAWASRGINVEELVTECVSAAMSGETLFKATAKVALPAGVDLPSLRADLDRIANDLLVDISLTSLENA